MLAASSNRAFSSIKAVTDFPASAASHNASTIGEFFDVLYNVCFIARTFGSLAAC